MMTSSEAAESLERIRGVLERATRYRLIAWQGILMAGGLAFAASSLGSRLAGAPSQRPATFLGLWGGALACAFACGGWTTLLKARAAGEPIWSRKMTGALLGLSPALLAGLLLTTLLADIGRLELVPGVWMALYGVGILAVAHWLDWEFHLTAWAFLAAAAIALFPLRDSPHLAMALSFGAIHVILGLYRCWRERP